MSSRAENVGNSEPQIQSGFPEIGNVPKLIFASNLPQRYARNESEQGPNLLREPDLEPELVKFCNLIFRFVFSASDRRRSSYHFSHKRIPPTNFSETNDARGALHGSRCDNRR